MIMLRLVCVMLYAPAWLQTDSRRSSAANVDEYLEHVSRFVGIQRIEGKRRAVVTKYLKKNQSRRLFTYILFSRLSIHIYESETMIRQYKGTTGITSTRFSVDLRHLYASLSLNYFMSSRAMY